MEPPKIFSGYNIKSVDASVITEPGSTGTDWRLHYANKLFTLQCDQFVISRPDLGESFVNFKIDDVEGDHRYSGRRNRNRRSPANGNGEKRHGRAGTDYCTE